MTRVAVFGEMLVDQFASGPVAGGAPFNVARHLAAFDHAPSMISAVGVDAAAQLLLAECSRYGLARDGVQVTPAHPTGIVEVKEEAGTGHEFIIRRDCAWDFIALAPARAQLAALADDGWLYSGTLALRSPVSRDTGLALLREHRGPKYVDLNWRAGHVSREAALEAIALADVLKVNDEELAMLGEWLGIAGTAQSIESSAAFVLTRIGLRLLLVTCGADGAMAFDGTGALVAHAAARRALKVVDTVGAGDSFSAVALAGLLRGWDVPLMLQRANEFAGHICEQRGAAPADLAAYGEWGKGWGQGASPSLFP